MDKRGGGEGWGDNRKQGRRGAQGGWRLAVASVEVGSMLIFSGSYTCWLQPSEMLTQIQTDLLDFGETQLSPVSRYAVHVSQQLCKQKKKKRT